VPHVSHNNHSPHTISRKHSRGGEVALMLNVDTSGFAPPSLPKYGEEPLSR